MDKEKKNLSSLGREWWWKFAGVYISTFVYLVFVAVLILTYWNIENPNINPDYIVFFKNHIIQIYLLLAFWLLVLIFCLFLHNRLVRIQVDPDTRKIYFNKIEQDRDRIHFVAEMFFFGDLFVLIKLDGILRVWLPKKPIARDIVWPLPLYFRVSPKNENTILFCSILAD